MDKRTLLALVLSFIVIFGWTYVIVPIFAPEAPVVDNSSAAKIPTAPVNSASIVDNNTAVNKVELQNNSVVSSAPATLTTEKSKLMEVVFNSQTGDIRSVSLLNWADTEGGRVTFNKNGNTDYAYLLTPVTSGYTKTVTQVDNGIVVSFTAEAGSLVVTKSYELSNTSYIINTSVSVTNTGSSSLNVPLNVKIGPKLGSGFEDSMYVFEGAVITNGGKTYRIEAEDTDRETLDNAVWAGYTSKYFLFAAASNDLFKKAEISPENNLAVASISTDFIVNPSGRYDAKFSLYVGPKYYDELKSYGLSLQKSMDYGWFYFIAIPMLYILNFLYDIFHNYGIAIIILTIIVKILTLPLTIKSMVSMKEMTKLQPKMMELREKYKNDPAKLNQLTMQLYKEHNVNPFSGCFPLLLQIPIFFALYKALLLSLELKGAPFFGWIVDLSAKDPYYITPILMGIAMFIQQKMTPSTADPVQQKIFLAMPIIFTFLFINFQSGLVLYWLTNNILSIIQQYIINKRK